MKKHLLIQIFLILMYLNGQAQFNDFYNIGEIGMGTNLRDIHIDDTNNHVGLTTVGNSTRIFSLDSLMNLNWIKEIDSGAYGVGKHLVPLGSGRFVAHHGTSSQMGNFHKLICFNQQGQILWDYEISGASEVWDVSALSNGNIAVTGLMTSSLESWIMVIDGSGTIQWSKQIDDPFDAGVAYDILALNDNSFLTVATVSATNNLPRYLFTKWDFNGNIVWDKAFNYFHNSGEGEYIFSMTQASSGEIYAAGFRGNPTILGSRDVFVRRFDSEMNHISGKAYGYMFDDSSYGIIEDHEGKLLVVGKSKPILNCAGLGAIYRLEPNLDTNYVRYYGTGPSVSLSLNKIYRKDSMYYVPGTGGLLSTIGPMVDGHLIKTDEQFNLSCAHFSQETNVYDLPDYITTVSGLTYNSFPISLSPISNEINASIQTELICSGPGPVSTVNTSELDQMNFEVFPIPAFDKISIQSETRFTKISILDMQGRELVHTNVAPTQNHDIDVSHLATGTYFLIVSQNDSTQMQRIQIH